ncbi:bifunctional diaminohydroxyphosphoribosylaminopyrimidine deaminase/5-amino-6-(5-phosphoribosylamino)uracil reductase RibD [Gordonia sp. VNQ95]|uniref:bifunctional diaminohydroxyphosphoribosylaminopyrimidine deaminase/5-amino-6-(5-phosphoribosylamino)uracil reductase RibD n=1 Tax=Gordonia TaxID=2053 RepID=UPI0032B3C127
MAPPMTVLDAAMADAIAYSSLALSLSRPNPAVGALIIADDGTEISRGHTQRAGEAHAEVMALRAAGEAARGATAVVTLEPCNHTGRTGPCAVALIEAGVRRVVYAVADPNPTASGGADRLRAAGVEVIDAVGEAAARSGPLRGWLFRQQYGRPLVTAKIAATLDGRIAAPDGTSQWITGGVARARAHRQRAEIDAIIVGTGTVLADDPALTARLPDGSLSDRQPIRVAMGHREIPDGAAISRPFGEFRHVHTHDPEQVLAALDDTTWVLVEGGPRIIGAFLDAGLVDEVEAYLAPTVLGAGASAVHSDAVTTLSDATRLRLDGIERLGDDILLTCRSPRLPN